MQHLETNERNTSMTATPPLPPSTLDIEKIRSQFPILSGTQRGQPLVFLDSGASSQRPQAVLDAVQNFEETSYANIHRGVYELSQKATEAYEASRLKVQTFLNAPLAKECLFTRGTTEGINLVASSWGRANLKQGDEILLTEMEHHSNIVPWQLAAQAAGAKVVAWPIDDRGQLKMEALEPLLNSRTKMVAVTHVSNVLGTINPIQEICKAAHEVGALVLVDGAQAAPHMAVDVQDLGCDFYVFSGHKMFAPSGIGVLWGKADLLNAMPPWQGGGGMIDQVSLETSTYLGIPERFEAGTPPITAAVGLGAAIDYLLDIGMDQVEAAEAELLAYATEQLLPIEGLTLIGTADKKASVLSFTLEGIHPHDLGTLLDQTGVAVRCGHHCAQPLMKRMGVTATTRASLAVYNTRDDVDRLVQGIRKAQSLFL